MDTSAYLPGETPRQALLRRYGALDNEYATWLPRQREIMQHLQPYRGRFVDGEQNRGFRKDQFVVNDTGIDSQKKLVAACATSMTSGVREWCRLSTADPLAAEKYGNRQYLHQAQDLMFQIFAESNFYKVIPQFYADMGGPATGVLWFEPDPKTVVRFSHFPVGSYRLAVNERGVVDTLYRRFEMTTAQLVMKFGYDACSFLVRQAWDQQRYDIWFLVQHSVEPRRLRDPKRIDNKNMPWASTWLEVGVGSTRGGSGSDATAPMGVLKESGFPIQPFVCGRWSVNGEDVYGSESPGWQTIGDVRALQSLEIASASQIAFAANPSYNVPPGLENASVVPGGRVQLPQSAGDKKLEPTVVIDSRNIEQTRQEKQVFEARIRRGHFADLLMLISQDTRNQRATAAEIHAGEQERLLQLGGMFERLSDEVLGPIVNAVLYYGQLQGRIPRPPADLGKVDVEYLNILAAAQKTIGIQGVERLINNAIGMATASGKPEILDKIDFDEGIDTMADMLGTKPSLVRPDDQVAKIRADRAKQQAAQAQGEAMAKAAPAVQQFSETDPEKLQQLLQAMSPGAAAAGGVQ